MKKILSVTLSLLLVASPIKSNFEFTTEATMPPTETLQPGVFERLSSFLVANPFVKSVSTLNFALSSITGIFFTAHSWYNLAKNLCQRTNLKFSKVNQNVDEVISSFEKELECIKGQEAAKLKMKEIVAAIIDARNEAKENKKPYGKGDVIYIIGPSGVGKSFSAQCLAKAIMGNNVEPLQVDSSCFETSSTISKKSQLLYMRTNQKNNDMRYYVDTSLAAKIAANPKSLLIFDEYDKWGDKETDEFLRTIIDKGVIYRDGEKINCSELLVLVISNEDRSSVTAGNKMGAYEDDGTGSRTHVVHDKSFLNRLNVIEFENLNIDAYEEIAKNKLDVLLKRFKQKYSLILDLGDTAKNIAIKTARTNQGAREIDKILAKFRTAVITTRERTEKLANQKFKVKYDYDENRFTLFDEKDESFTSDITPTEPQQSADDFSRNVNEIQQSSNIISDSLEEIEQDDDNYKKINATETAETSEISDVESEEVVTNTNEIENITKPITNINENVLENNSALVPTELLLDEHASEIENVSESLSKDITKDTNELEEENDFNETYAKG